MWGALVEDGGLGTEEVLGSQKPPVPLFPELLVPLESKKA